MRAAVEQSSPPAQGHVGWGKGSQVRAATPVARGPAKEQGELCLEGHSHLEGWRKVEKTTEDRATTSGSVLPA